MANGQPCQELCYCVVCITSNSNNYFHNIVAMVMVTSCIYQVITFVYALTMYVHVLLGERSIATRSEDINH